METANARSLVARTVRFVQAKALSGYKRPRKDGNQRVSSLATRRDMMNTGVRSREGDVRLWPITILGEHIRRESTQISGYFGCPVGR
jgi:hypothetical protein